MSEKKLIHVGLKLLDGSYIENASFEILADDPIDIKESRIWYNSTISCFKYSKKDELGDIVVRTFTSKEELLEALLDYDSSIKTFINTKVSELGNVLKYVGVITPGSEISPLELNTLIKKDVGDYYKANATGWVKLLDDVTVLKVKANDGIIFNTVGSIDIISNSMTVVSGNINYVSVTGDADNGYVIDIADSYKTKVSDVEQELQDEINARILAVTNAYAHIDSSIENLELKLGNINNLQTIDKTSAVNSINELKVSIDTLQQQVIDNDNNLDQVIVDLEQDIETQLSSKVDKISGKGLSTEDYTSAEKTKLSNIEANANNYVHPDHHSPSIITQDADNRFVTDIEKAAWSGKAEVNDITLAISQLKDSVSSDGDTLAKLRLLITNINNVLITDDASYNTIQKITNIIKALDNSLTNVENSKVNISDIINVLTDISTDKPLSALQGKVLKDLIDALTLIVDTKVDKVAGKGLSTEDYTSAEKTKLAGIATNANNYVHPSTHAPSIIVQDSNNRFVTDVEKATWSGKENAGTASSLLSIHIGETDPHTQYAKSASLGTMSVQNADNVNITGGKAILTFDGNVAPLSLPNVGTVDPTNLNDGDIWFRSNNLYMRIAGYNRYFLRNDTYSTISQSEIEAGTATSIRWMTSQRVRQGTVAWWNTSAEKTKLDGIEANANNYIHPSSHAPSIITQDANNRFVTDVEKAAWSGKAEVSQITTAINNLKDGVSTDGDTLAKLRSLITGIQTVLQSNDTDLDSLQEVVTFIKEHEYDISQIGLTKVNISDIINVLTSTATDKPLSAAQGKVLKDLLDSLTTTVNNKVDKISGKGLSTEDYTSVEKTKLAGIAINANNYVHPSTHPASIIVQDASNRFVTDTEKATWSGKENAGTASSLLLAHTNESDPHSQYAKSASLGTMSVQNADAVNISGGKAILTFNGTNAPLGLPNTGTVDPSSLVNGDIWHRSNNIYVRLNGATRWLIHDSTYSTVTQAEIEAGTATTVRWMTSQRVRQGTVAWWNASAEKTKLDGIEANANNYTHPANHSPSIITQDSNNRFVTDAEKAIWSGKENAGTASSLLSVHTSAADPHSQYAKSASLGTMSVQNADSVNIAGGKATLTFNGTNAPLSLPNTGTADPTTVNDGDIWFRSNNLYIRISGTTRIITHSGTYSTISQSEIEAGTSTTVRLMTAQRIRQGTDAWWLASADKTKLDGIEVNANNYIHPANHPASIITQDANNRFVTDTEKSTWNAKENAISISTTSNYFRGDKTWRNFSGDVRATTLTGIVFTDAAAVLATDSILIATGKLQAKLNTLGTISTQNSDNVSVTGGKVLGLNDFSLTGNFRVNMPADLWTTPGLAVNPLAASGILYSNGSYRGSWLINGYRNNAGTWTSLSINGYTGASGIEIDPQGYIYFRAEGDKPTGSSYTINQSMAIGPNGNVQIGPSTPALYISLQINKYLTGGSSAYGLLQSGIVKSDVTGTAYGIRNISYTEATSFTLGSYVHFFADQGTIGANSSITSQYGFYVNGNITSASYNFGFFSTLNEGAGRWNLYLSGTAANYISGKLLLGTTTTSNHSKLQVQGDSTVLSRATNTTFDTPTNVELSLYSYVSTNNQGTAQITFHTDRNDRYSAIGTYRGSTSNRIGLSFFTNLGTDVPVETLRIDEYGNFLPANDISVNIGQSDKRFANIYSELLYGTLTNTGLNTIHSPGGGQFITSLSSKTGAIKVILPVGYSNSFLTIAIRVFNYSSNTSFDLVVSGYNYSSNNSWQRTTAYLIGDPDINRLYTVRFGYNAAGKCVIYIGELGSTWSYPQVFILNVTVGYTGQTAALLKDWQIDFEATAFENVTSTITNKQIGYRSVSNVANSLVLRDDNGDFSAGNITANSFIGNASTATTLATSRSISITGDANWTVNFNGSANVTAALTLANSGVTAGTYKSVTVNAKGVVTAGTNPTTLAGYGITDAAPSSHVGATGAAHGNASTSVAGFMSSADKTKLDGIAANANNYSLPAASSSVIGGIELFSDTIQSTAANAVTTTASRTYGLQVNAAGQGVINVPWTDTTYSVATTSANGLLSSSDKTKLDGIAANANNYSHPTGDGNLHVPANGTSNNRKWLMSGATAGTYTWESILASDIPTLNQNTTGSSAKLTTARTLTIGNTGKTFDGSANVSWSLSEIGANNASNLTTGTVPDARLSGVYSGLSVKINGGNSIFTTPNTGSPELSTARTVYGLAEFRSAATIATGAIVFIAPNTTSNIMHQLEIAGMRHGGHIFRFIVQGYRTTGDWASLKKVNYGSGTTNVRFAVNPEGKNCIIIGDVSSTWGYPHFVIVKALFSHNNIGDTYCKDWTTALVTDLTSYTYISAPIEDSPLEFNITGNAATLTTSRNINGTAFNGSADITTTKWGTARNINSISIDGSSANYYIPHLYDSNGKLTLQSIGVASAVNYLTLSNSASGAEVIVSTGGTDSNIGLKITTKGTGGISLDTGTSTGDIHFKPGTGKIRLWDTNVSNNYQISIPDITSNYVITLPAGNVTLSAGTMAITSRIISTGDGLSGGGDLSADRTLTVDATVIRTTGDQSMSGKKTFYSPVIVTSTFNKDGSDANQQQDGLYIADLGTAVGTTLNPTYTAAICAQVSGSRSIAVTVSTDGYMYGYRAHSNTGLYTFQSKTRFSDALTNSRTLTIGATAQTFNGTADVTWTLAQIGADNASNLISGVVADNLISGDYNKITSLGIGDNSLRGPVVELGSIVPGSGYVNGTYANVLMTGGTGAGFYTDITVESGGVTSVIIKDEGQRFSENDILTTPNTNLGGTGSGFTVTVTKVRRAAINIYKAKTGSDGPRIRLMHSSSMVDGDEIGSILFGSYDSSAYGRGDKGRIIYVAEGVTGGARLQIWTATGANPSALALEVTGGNALRLYNSASTFKHSITSPATADRTLTLADGDTTLVAGTMVPVTGTGANGTWGISVTGSAATLTTARTLTIGNTGKTFNGSANVSWSLTEIGADNASNLSTGTLPDARLSGLYTNLSLKVNGGNTLFSSPSSGSQSDLGRTVYGLAEFRSSSSGHTGIIAFIAPNSNTAIMHTFEITAMLYNSTDLLKMEISGYRNSSGGFSYYKKILNGNKDILVRFALTAGNRTCLLLGDVDTVWSYPHVSITKAMFSHSNVSDAYCKDWTVATLTDISSYTAVTTVPTQASSRTRFMGEVNTYNGGGVETLGSGTDNLIYPTLGFHQPGLHAASFQLVASKDLRLYHTDNIQYTNLTLGDLYSNKLLSVCDGLRGAYVKVDNVGSSGNRALIVLDPNATSHSVIGQGSDYTYLSREGEISYLNHTGTGTFYLQVGGSNQIQVTSTLITLDSVTKITGNLSLNLPSDCWTTSGVFPEDNGNAGLLYSHGAYRSAWLSNGYRNSAGTWTSLAVNGYTGAAGIELDPQGYIYIRTEAVKATGDSYTIANYSTFRPNGNFTIGGSGADNVSLSILSKLTGATTAYGISQIGVVQSDVTNAAYGIRNNSNCATGVSLSSYYHFSATEGTLNSAVIGGQYGYYVGNIAGATNNYGFYGAMSSGSGGKWNLYMAGSAPNHLLGSLGIGTTSISGKLHVQGGTTVLARTTTTVVPPTAELSLYSHVSTNYVGTPQLTLHSDRNDRYSAIGTYRHNVSGNIGISFFTCYDTSAPVETLRLDNTGRLLLGSYNPVSVYINNVEVKSYLQNNGTSAEQSANLQVRYTADDNGPLILLGKSRGTTVGSYTAVQNGDILGRISAFGANGTDFREAGYISIVSDGTPSTTAMPGAINFATTPAGTNVPVIRYKIDSQGHFTPAVTESLNLGSSSYYFNTVYTNSVELLYGFRLNRFESGSAISDLMTGSKTGAYIKAAANTHLVIYLDGNDDDDSFCIVSHTATTDSTSDKTPDKVLLRVKRKGDTTINGMLASDSLGVINTSNTSGKGISLYGGAVGTQPTYGLMFAGTGTYSKHGDVQGDWATYFTMNTSTNRGWIFKGGTGSAGNVASINNVGKANFASVVTGKDTVSTRSLEVYGQSSISNRNNEDSAPGDLFAQHTAGTSLSFHNSGFEITQVTCVADSSGSLNNKYFRLYGQNVTSGNLDVSQATEQIVDVWFNVNGAGVVPASGAGRYIEVALATNATVATVAAAIESAFTNDPAFYAFADSDNNVHFTSKVSRALTDSTAGTSGFTVTKVADGTTILSGTDKWAGGVLAPNGKIYCIPYSATSILVIDPKTDKIYTFGSISGSAKYIGGTLAHNGKIYCIPYNATTILVIDPSNDTTYTFGSLTGSNKWWGCSLAPNGKIYGVPYTSDKILLIDPSTDTATTFGSYGTTAGKWASAVLSGTKIYCAPFNATNILVIETKLDKTKFIGSISGSSKYMGGVLYTNGVIYFAPYNATTLLRVDTFSSDSVSTYGTVPSGSGKYMGAVLTPDDQMFCIPLGFTSALRVSLYDESINNSVSVTGSSKWWGGVLAPNGKIYCIPRHSLHVGIIDSGVYYTLLNPSYLSAYNNKL